MAIQVMNQYSKLDWNEALQLVKKHNRNMAAITREMTPSKIPISLSVVNPGNTMMCLKAQFDQNEEGMVIITRLQQRFPPP